MQWEERKRGSTLLRLFRVRYERMVQLLHKSVDLLAHTVTVSRHTSNGGHMHIHYEVQYVHAIMPRRVCLSSPFPLPLPPPHPSPLPLPVWPCAHGRLRGSTAETRDVTSLIKVTRAVNGTLTQRARVEPL
jgi:hypothetical protein